LKENVERVIGDVFLQRRSLVVVRRSGRESTGRIEEEEEEEEEEEGGEVIRGFQTSGRRLASDEGGLEVTLKFR